MKTADIGIIGLAVMGENLACNLADHGYTVAVYNIEPELTVRAFQKAHPDSCFLPAYSLPELVKQLSRPRKILLMIRAGSPVDEVLSALFPLLSPGDILIDGGNSHWQDTARRCSHAESAGFRYVGMGVSGGADGARYGPALMPGGSASAWDELRPILETISAKGADGSPCCVWMGGQAAGHFVKMVHNGIEYGEMQLLCEVYHLLSAYLRLSYDEIADLFDRWEHGPLSSFLTAATVRILRKRDRDGVPLLDHIRDTAGQKGTGRWTVSAALETGVPLPLITESVFARQLSADFALRKSLSSLYGNEFPAFSGSKEVFLADLRDALLAARLISYAQGFALLRAAGKEQDLTVQPHRLAMLWTGGCIIRSALLQQINCAFRRTPDLESLCQAPNFQSVLFHTQAGWRRVCSAAIQAGIPVPALSSALAWFDACRCGVLPANLIQAQRDYFGAHGYERTDAPAGTFFHTDWAENGEETIITAYQA